MTDGVPEQHQAAGSLQHDRRQSARETVEQLFQLLLQYVGGLAICIQIATVRIGDAPMLRARRVSVDDVYLPAAAELDHLLDVAGRHHEDQIGFGNDRRRKLSGAVSSQVEL